MNRKPVIAIDISSTKRGGPYVACKNIMDSILKDDYVFKEIEYNNELGRFISWKRINDLKCQILAINPDGIIITGLQLSCFHVCVAALLAGVKTRIITIHGSSTEALYLSKIKKVLLYIIEFLSLWMCSSFYGVSKYASTISAVNFFKNKNRGHVYNLPTTEKKTIFEVTRDTIGLSSSDIIVSSSGRITKEKGYEVLAHAIKLINNSNIKFVILGDGNYLSRFRDELSKEIELGKVVCPGFTENVYGYLGISDIFVLPTLHETLSVSLLEASKASLPLISCNVGGVPEVIENGMNGILVEPDKPNAIAQAIIDLAQNSDKRIIMGQNSSMRLKKIFAKEESLAKLKDIINTDLSRWMNV